MFEILKRVLTAERFSDFPKAKYLTISHVVINIALAILSIIFSIILFLNSSPLWALVRVFLILIAANVSICLYKEYYLAKNKIREFTIKREFIRKILTLLIRAYDWKAICRVTLFVPRGYENKSGATEHRIVAFERISGGRPSGFDRESPCFFRRSQGIPGKAWGKSWDGNNPDQLIRCFAFGTVPSDVINQRRDKVKDFFRTKFDVSDDDIFDSLSDDKYKIRSYMAVGILNEDQSLAAIIGIDSENENQFAEFEQLQHLADKPMQEVSRKLSLMFTSDGETPKFLRVLSEIADLSKEAKELGREFEKGDYDKAQQFIKTAGIQVMASEIARNVRPNISSALIPFDWALKTIKETLKMS